MHRTQTYTLAFSLAAVLVTVVSAVLAYQGVRAAFEREFAARLLERAELAASQVGAADVAEVRRYGLASNAYDALEVQLLSLRSAMGLSDLALVDSAGTTLYDVRDPELRFGRPSTFDSLAHGALVEALAGRPGVRPLARPGAPAAGAAFAPVREAGRPVAVIVAVARAVWVPELERLLRRLQLIAAVSVVAVAVLAGILVGGIGRLLALERRLSRSENLAAMGRLTATLAHEIKNPLAIIRGSAKRLGRLEPGAARMADSVVEEVDRLTRTVGRYLQVARGEEPPVGSGDLAAALAATLDLLEGEFRARGCALEHAGDPAPARVRMDAESLKQVCLNLVLNALEALPEGGTVRAGLARSGGRVAMTIEDDGPGMPAEVARRLGEPFLTTKAQGTGLGLFMTRRLVEGAGGVLRAAQAGTRGTRVTVELPLERDEASGRGATRS